MDCTLELWIKINPSFLCHSNEKTDNTRSGYQARSGVGFTFPAENEERKWHKTRKPGKTWKPANHQESRIHGAQGSVNPVLTDFWCLQLSSITPGLLWVNHPKSSSSIFLPPAYKIVVSRCIKLICVKFIYAIHGKIKIKLWIFRGI